MLQLWPQLSFAELPRNRWQIPNGWGSKMRFAIFLFIAEKWWHSLKIVLPLRVTIAYSKYCTMLSSSAVSNSSWPIDCNPPGSSVHGDSLGKNTGVGCHALLQGICPIQGSNPGLPPALQAESLPSEPPGKPKNIGMGSLSLLQGIFPTQELNQGLLHCRWILYQLSYQESPVSTIKYLMNTLWNFRIVSLHPS